jgi:hypothetical protein
MAAPKGSAGAEETQFRFQYAAKFLCIANIPGTSATTTSVHPGTYSTAINIHNPNEEVVRLREKLALGPEFITSFVEDRLNADAMIRIDCSEISSRFGPFIHGSEGFLIIESSHSLDVIAVYTAGPVGEQVASIDVERVQERLLGQEQPASSTRSRGQ